MNKEYLHTLIISSRVFDISLCDLENIKANLIKFGLALFIHREHSAFNFHSDYIEQETTKGGLTLIKSMLKNSFINHFNLNASNVYPTTSDLNVTIDNNSKTKYRVGTILIPIN